MIETIEGGVLLSCDFCSTEMELKVHTIERVNEAAVKHGWVVRQNDHGDWQHACPCCRDDIMVAKAA